MPACDTAQSVQEVPSAEVGRLTIESFFAESTACGNTVHVGKPCTDHLGNEFPSQAAMCEHWGVDVATYGYRRRKDWTLEEALTGERPELRGGHNAIPSVDHLGNEFPSQAAMCGRWGVDASAYGYRRRKGWTLEEALTGEHPELRGGHNAIPSVDHLGNEFPSKSAMCTHWGIPYYVYMQRVRAGWDLERALTVEDGRSHGRSSKPCVDHEGNEFPSKAAMCEHWGVEPPTFRGRLSRGWTLEQALTGDGPEPHDSHNTIPIVDHLGNEFPSKAAMCRHWGVGDCTYASRRKKGWDLERALTDRPEFHSSHNAVPCTDHLGNEFPSKSAMCRAWDVSFNVYDYRIRAGWTLEQALTGTR